MSDGLMMEDRANPPETSFAGAGKPVGGLLAAGALSMPDTSGPGPVALQEPARWVYDFDPATGVSRATFNGLVQFTEGGSESAGVTSWNGQTGAVVMQASDIVDAGGLANPSVALTGVPTAPTASIGTSSTQVATCAFVAQAIVAGAGVTSFNARQGAITLTSADIMAAGGAPLASPAMIGVPTAPTASQGDVSNQVATDAFVANALASGAVTAFNGRRGAVSLTLSDVESVGGAPIASPVFTGSPLVPTAPPGSATTQAASTAFVTNAVAGSVVGVSSFNTRTGAVVFNASDLASVGGAPLVSPAFTSNPTAPTPSAGDNSTRIATTAYVETAIGNLPSGVATWNGRSGTVTLALSDVTSVGGAPLASPAMTGTPSAPTPPPLDNSTRLATTAFVEAALPAVPAPSAALPLINGTAAAGSSAAWSRGDHVHPTDTTRAAQSALAGYMPVAGGTFTGGVSTPSIAVSGAFPNAATGLVSAQGATGMGIYYNTATALFAIYEGGALADTLPYGYTAGTFFGLARMGMSNTTLQAYMVNNNGASFYAALTSASDRKLKSGIAPSSKSAIDTIKALGVYEFELDQPGVELAKHWDFGLIADEVESVIPPAFVPASDAPGSFQSLRELPIVAALVKAVQELTARVEELEQARPGPAWSRPNW